jgi:hypothetical protein
MQSSSANASQNWMQQSWMFNPLLLQNAALFSPFHHPSQISGRGDEK